MYKQLCAAIILSALFSSPLNAMLISLDVLKKGEQTVYLFGDMHTEYAFSDPNYDRILEESSAQFNALKSEIYKLSPDRTTILHEVISGIDNDLRRKINNELAKLPGENKATSPLMLIPKLGYTKLCVELSSRHPTKGTDPRKPFTELVDISKELSRTSYLSKLGENVSRIEDAIAQKLDGCTLQSIAQPLDQIKFQAKTTVEQFSDSGLLQVSALLDELDTSCNAYSKSCATIDKLFKSAYPNARDRASSMPFFSLMKTLLSSNIEDNIAAIIFKTLMKFAMYQSLVNLHAALTIAQEPSNQKVLFFAGRGHMPPVKEMLCELGYTVHSAIPPQLSDGTQLTENNYSNYEELLERAIPLPANVFTLLGE